MSGKKKHTTPNEYLKYLKGDLTNQERHSFERNLEADPFEKEAMEGFGQLSPEQAEKDILSLHASMRKRLGRKRRIAFYSAAASIASLLIIGTVFLQIHNFHPSSDEQAESLPVEILTEEAMTMEAQADDETAGGAITRDPAIRESSVKPVKEEQVSATEKGPSKAEAVPAAEVPVAEVPVAEVPVAVVQDVQVFQDVQLPQEDTEADLITYLEATETQSRKQTGRQKESLSQTASERPPEMSKKAISLEEPDQLNEAISLEETGQLNEAISLEETGQLNEAISLEETGQLISGEASRLVTSAEPSGGLKAFKNYIEENIQFPAEDTITRRAIVILKFAVTPAGEIKEIMALRSPGQPFTNEAIRVVLEGPQWSPASDETGTIEEIIRLRIVFRK